jgi:microcystin-dependent protein
MFAPEGWALCDGSTLPIDGNQALFSLIGTAFGGDGTTTFKLPDLRSRVVVGSGSGGVDPANQPLTPRAIGQTGARILSRCRRRTVRRTTTVFR